MTKIDAGPPLGSPPPRPADWPEGAPWPPRILQGIPGHYHVVRESESELGRKPTIVSGAPPKKRSVRDG